MYPTRYIVRPSCAQRLARAAPAATRNMSYFPAPFHPRGFPSADFNSVFRLFDESTRGLDSLFSQSLFNGNDSARQAFSPRFDVREVDGAYELRGELPGVEAQNLEVQFTDPKTLVISGRTERETSSGTAPQAIQAEQPQQSIEDNTAKAATLDNSDAASNHSESSYQKPSVEDDYVDAGEEAATNAAVRESTEATAKATPAAEAVAQQAPQQPEQPQSRYFVSERSVGQFSRTFNFANNIDTEAVSASLKNGILEILVPKAKEPEVRKISVQ